MSKWHAAQPAEKLASVAAAPEKKAPEKKKKVTAPATDGDGPSKRVLKRRAEQARKKAKLAAAKSGAPVNEPKPPNPFLEEYRQLSIIQLEEKLKSLKRHERGEQPNREERQMRQAVKEQLVSKREGKANSAKWTSSRPL